MRAMRLCNIYDSQRNVIIESKVDFVHNFYRSFVKVSNSVAMNIKYRHLHQNNSIVYSTSQILQTWVLGDS